MAFKYKLGKNPDVSDPLVPHFSAILGKLPAPPDSIEWTSKVASWHMLGNDFAGDCVVAAILHSILQFSTYSGSPLIPSVADAIDFYSKYFGYVEGDESTDQGSYVIGPGGAMTEWLHNGITCGDTVNKCSSYLQITHPAPEEWMQAVAIFGGMLVGVNLPENVVSGEEPPALWDDPSGPVAGGHEIWVNGYIPSSNPLKEGPRLWDLISWGQRFQCTEKFLKAVAQGAVVVTDGVEFGAAGLDAAGLSAAQLQADIRLLHAFA